MRKDFNKTVPKRHYWFQITTVLDFPAGSPTPTTNYWDSVGAAFPSVLPDQDPSSKKLIGLLQGAPGSSEISLDNLIKLTTRMQKTCKSITLVKGRRRKSFRVIIFD